MATIEKTKSGYRAKVYIGKVDGKTRFESISGKTKAEVKALAAQREAEKSGKAYPIKTFGEAIRRYEEDVAPAHKGARWEIFRCQSFLRMPIAKVRMAKLTSEHLAEFRDQRLKEVAPNSVLRELNIINSIIEVARREWKWLGDNPLKDVRKPTAPPGRRRRVSEAEIASVVQAAGWTGGEPQSSTQIAVVAFLFAIETAMRSGEILGLTWDAVHDRKVTLPKTKNGDRREVPLSPRARELLSYLRAFDRPFPIANGSRDALFRKVVVKSQLVDLHFHYSRAEAIYRLSKKLDVLELARCIGHRDINSLRHYYNATADELADKLG